MRNIKVPRVLWERAKKRQKRLKKEGITRPLFELVAEELSKKDDIFRGGLRF